MQKLKELAAQLKIHPKIQLGIKQAGGGVNSTGPHKVKFIEEPAVVMGRDHEGKPRKELRFLLQEGEATYRWNVPILNKESQPNYLVERLIDVEIGDERVLEMRRQGQRNYIDVRKTDEEPSDEPPDEEEVIEHD